MAQAALHTWSDDVLPGWRARALAVGDGAVATLVRPTVQPPGNKPAVLYVHGFVDYFFHTHVAAAFAAGGYPFYAVDLRGYGRSIAGLPSAAEPNYVTDLSVYRMDLDAAAAAIKSEGHPRIVVLAHSMGGLVASLWANARPGLLDALVLNSPWLDLNASWFHRVVATPVIDLIGRVAPKLPVGKLGADWGRALHISTGGEWDYNLAWKPINGFPVRAGWLREIRHAQALVARGLAIDCPVLVLSAARSGPDDRWHPELLTTDSVLNVEHIRARAPHLGRDVTQVVIDDGAHDLALSGPPARDVYLETVLDWLDARITPGGRPGAGERPATD